MSSSSAKSSFHSGGATYQQFTEYLHDAEATAATIDSADVVDQLTAYAQQRMSPYKVPARWFLADGELPLTPTGKIRKFQLRDQIEKGLIRELRAQAQSGT